MRFCLTLLLIAVNTFVLAQFSDDFEDGDFTNSPTWTGETANFIVNGSNELQLFAPAVTDTSYLSIPTTNINNTTWNFYVRLEFNPSSSNYARIYLVSDNTDLKGSLNGYYVMVGNTADEISLYRQDGTAVTEIIDGLDDSMNDDPCEARIQVTRDGAGNWELFRDTLGGTNYFSEGTVLDATHTVNSFAGVFCRYTSTRSEKFFYDDIGDPYVDAVSPTIDTVIVISTTEIDVQFSEGMDQTTAEAVGNYSVDQGIGNPSTAVQDGVDASLIHLTFGSAFTNGTNYVITVNNVEDESNNAIAANSTFNFLYFIPGVPTLNDVIITEVFADPSPTVGLPEVEYVEVYNRSNQTFDLSGWTLSDGSSSGTFGTYILAPDQYLLICGTGDCAQFFVSNSTELTLPSLNNSDDAVVLKDDMGNLIDSIYYESSWYGDGSKEDGGWSLERRHNDAPCNDASNWGASTNVFGGTPALQNSIWTDQNDTTLPIISSFTVNSATNLTINFNEILDTAVAANLSIVPTVSGLNWNWTSVQTLNVDINTMVVNQIYELSISGASDCWGNSMSTDVILLGIPDSIVEGDLILNEVMFNPLTGGSDYIELYNHSDKILDLQEIFIADWDDSIANYKSVMTEQRLLLPEEYVLITEDTADIINDFTIYGLGTFIETDLPTYPNDSGTVYVLSKDSLILDYFHYDEDFHFELISDDDGKSLERISFDGAMNDPDNWHTAAEYAEWGTPGYENSQLFVADPVGEVSLDPPTFSPDNDGYQDIVTITLDLQTTDNVVDIEIFDSYGRLIRLLKDNFFIGNNATFTWDGITDKGDKANIGTYVILVSVVDENGEQTQHKLVVVLAGNL